MTTILWEKHVALSKKHVVERNEVEIFFNEIRKVHKCSRDSNIR